MRADAARRSGSTLRRARRDLVAGQQCLVVLARPDAGKRVSPHHDLGRQRPPVVGRRHDGAVGAHVPHCQQGAGGERRQRPPAPQHVAALADRPGDIGLDCSDARRGLRHRLDSVPGVVERGPHQVVHGGVDDGPAALAGLLDRDHAGEQDACRRHQPATGFDHHRHAEALADTRDQCAVGLDIGRRLVPVAHAESAPEVEPCHRVAGPAQALHKRDEPIEGGLERRESRELRADVHGKAERLDAFERGGVRVKRRDVRVVDSELVAPPAGGDLVVGLGIDIRVDAERHRRPRAGSARGCVESLQLGRRFDVELTDPVASARSISSRVLPGPANTRRSGAMPARSAPRSSPPEMISAPAPRRARVRITARVSLALTA